MSTCPQDARGAKKSAADAACGASFVYIVQCADGTLYTGWTTDVEKRVSAHNSGKGARYTSGRTPVRLAYSEACPTKADALCREAEIKKMSRKAKLKLLETCK